MTHPLIGKSWQVHDHGSITVVDLMGDDARICESARLSTGSRTGTDIENSRLINYLMRHHHTSPFEQCELVLDVTMPIFVARQWARHRTAHVQEASARYQAVDPKFLLPDGTLRKQSQSNLQASNELLPEPIQKAGWDTFVVTQATSTVAYKDLLQQGVAREQARAVLPLSTYTTLRWKIDLHNLLHFIKLRIDPDTAQKEIVDYAKIIYDEIIVPWVPLTAKAFEQHVMFAYTLSLDERIKLADFLRNNLSAEVIAQSKLLQRLLGLANVALSQTDA